MKSSEFIECAMRLVVDLWPLALAGMSIWLIIMGFKGGDSKC